VILKYAASPTVTVILRVAANQAAIAKPTVTAIAAPSAAVPNAPADPTVIVTVTVIPAVTVIPTVTATAIPAPTLPVPS